MSASNKTWSWTVIVQTPSIYRDVPDFHDLRCSPQGQLLMVEKLVGKFFSIWAEDAPGIRLQDPLLRSSNRLAP